MKDKGSLATARKLLKTRGLLKAAVGIEPTNKDFADLSSYVSPNIMEHHRRVNIGFFSLRRTLHDTLWMQVLPTKVPTLCESSNFFYLDHLLLYDLPQLTTASLKQ
jgi:hypothetical protein